MRLDDAVGSARTTGWSVVLPVKQLARAKSRLGGALTPGVDELALAFFQDTASAALACGLVDEVLVATSDDRVAAWALARGCRVVSDDGHPGINAAAAEAARARSASMVAVMVSDLPCATPEAITAFLSRAAGHPLSFLADAAGTGTTTWASTGDDDTPHFGVGSRAAHTKAGAADLIAGLGSDPPLDPLRRDVDTEADLADAIRLGVGRHTEQALARNAPA